MHGQVVVVGVGVEGGGKEKVRRRRRRNLARDCVAVWQRRRMRILYLYLERIIKGGFNSEKEDVVVVLGRAMRGRTAEIKSVVGDLKCIHSRLR